jgi:hypothetical protein
MERTTYYILNNPNVDLRETPQISGICGRPFTNQRKRMTPLDSLSNNDAPSELQPTGRFADLTTYQHPAARRAEIASDPLSARGERQRTNDSRQSKDQKIDNPS